MGTITEEVNIDLIEKLIDGNFKIKYPKTIVSQIKDLSGIATQAEAQVGTGNSQVMTPLRVKDAILTLGGSCVTGTYLGTDTRKTINVGFTAKCIMVFGAASEGYFIDSTAAYAFDTYSTLQIESVANGQIYPVANGFSVYYDSGNKKDDRYRWVAWK